MSNTLKTVILILLGGAIASFFIWKCNSVKNPDVLSPIVHDTIVKKFYIHDTIKGATLVIPTYVTKYDSIPYLDTSVHVRVLHDTIKLVKHDTTTTLISPAFLILFPQSPKLLLGEFGQNNISLNLLGIDGQIVTKQYATDFTQYNYEFSGSELKFYPIKKQGTNFLSGIMKDITTTSFLSTTYNPFTQGATMKIDYNIMYKKIGATVWGQFSSDQVPHLNSGIGLRVQIK